MKDTKPKQDLRQSTSVIEHFRNLEARILKTTDLELIVRTLKKEEKISKRTTLEHVAATLAEEKIFRRIELVFPKETAVRFVRDGVSPYEVALTLRTSCYLSHLSALRVNGLTDDIPVSIYVNSEQRPKPPIPTPISQQSMDIAFRNPQRKTNNIALLGSNKIHILNGMHTGELGVLTIGDEDGQSLRTTGIERSLIDSVVRPEYSGGPATILKAFRIAGEKGICSPRTILKLLGKLDYRYPYLQALGFFMEFSGNYSDSLQLIHNSCDLQFDFYVSHGEAELEYSPRWRIYYPKWLKAQ